jgi:vancomycin resistance protein VanJ
VTHATLVEALLGVYAGGVVLWFLLRAGFGDRVTLVLLGNYLGVWLFAPLLLLIPWVMVARYTGGLPLWSLQLTLFAALPFLLFLHFYGRALVPPGRDVRVSAVDAVPERSFTVLTFNLLYGNHDVADVAGVLLASQADILALQEVRPTMHTRLRQALGADYPYHAVAQSGGLAVHSRFPILSEEVLHFEPWLAQHLTLQVETGDGTGTTLHLVNAHLAPVGVFPLLLRLDARPAQRAARARANQIDMILAALPQTGNPVASPAVVACDCNMTDLNATYTTMTRRLRDAYRERGWGLGHTFLFPRGFSVPSPVNLPAQRLDYLFHSDTLAAEDARVIRDPAGSDHLPVVARFRLATP